MKAQADTVSPGPCAATAAVGTLTIEGLHKRFGGVVALEGVSLEAHAGKVHALLGQNGAGKSTLIRILAGVERADRGSVSIAGVKLALGRPSVSNAAGVRTAFQELSSIPELTVAENLLYGEEPTLLGRVRRRRLLARAEELLGNLGLGRIDPTALVEELAFAERQLLEVARALRRPARALILDEATSALSDEESAWVLEQARRAAAGGAVVLLITHRLSEVRAAADRLTVLRSGSAVLTGSVSEHDDDELITAMLGRRVERLYQSPKRSGERVALSVRGLRVGGRVGPVDFDAREGEILGIGGLQGHGQRELLMALGGAGHWTGGEAQLGGRDYRPRAPRDALSRRVALVPEDRQREGLLLPLTVRTNVTLPSLARFARRGLLDTRNELTGARRGVERVGVPASRLAMPAGSLSGGNQQKVVLAKALLDDPVMLLLYDCTRGVDVGTKADIFAIMAELAASGTTILFYSSSLSELVNMCHRVAVMVEGKIGGVLDHHELSEEKMLRVAVGAHSTEEVTR